MDRAAGPGFLYVLTTDGAAGARELGSVAFPIQLPPSSRQAPRTRLWKDPCLSSVQSMSASPTPFLPLPHAGPRG